MNEGALPIGIIPARARSNRFPNKVIANILNKPMIQYVWEAAERATSLSDLWVATDDSRVLTAVEKFGGRGILTPDGFESGTDRVAYAVRNLNPSIVVNLQADEPLLPDGAIDKMVGVLEGSSTHDIATLAVWKSSRAELNDPNVVKVVVSGGQALYFSRAPIASDSQGGFFKHIGIYAYRRQALERFCKLPQSRLERAERLEQLRALENNMSIAVVEVEEDTIAVDMPGDIAKVEAVLRERMQRSGN